MIELPLAVYLLVVMPVRQMWRSLRKGATRVPARARARGHLYWSMTARLAAMLAVLAAACWYRGRTPDELGLGWPGTAGQWGIGLALVLVLLLHCGAAFQERRMDAAARAQLAAALEDGVAPPRTAGELAAFLVMCLALGAGWEILYRGFLLLVLAPHAGMAGAVVLAALAYGIGHGYSTPRQFAGSIVSAFVFTTAYALSGSLWWLIVIHIGTPACMGIAAWRRHKRQGAPDSWLAAPPP